MPEKIPQHAARPGRAPHTGGKRKATLERIGESFGRRSPVFVQCFRALAESFRAAKASGEVRAAFGQWERFSSIAYGSSAACEQNFLTHTYLSVFAKLLACAAVSDDDIDEGKMRGAIDGTIFGRYNVADFVEDDLFQWVAGAGSFPALKDSFSRIARGLAAYDFQDVDEDVLKGVYQEMIDLDTRHALGEYYTPDWLCERVVAEFRFGPEDKVLDPSCGSGSFLRAAVARVRGLHPGVSVEDLNEQIYGIDIHPLSVQLAKTTLLLAYGREVASASRPVRLNVVLANVLLSRRAEPAGRGGARESAARKLGRPHSLAGEFDYVVGNPPWLTYSDVGDEDYKDMLSELARERGVRPGRQADFPHLEIAAIFLAHCSGHFLRAGGRVAFVLPRSFFSADQHDNTRSGKAKGFRLTGAWDLKGVRPLFRVPSCVLFGEKREKAAAAITVNIEGRTFDGRVPAQNCNWAAAAAELTEESVTWFYVKQGRSTAFSTRQPTGKDTTNPYKKHFKQGATIVPRASYFVDVRGGLPSGFADTTVGVRTAEAIQPEAKRPWTGLDLKGRVESCFLFRTALSKSILPFMLFEPALVALPITVKQNSSGGKCIELRSAEELRKRGFLNAAKWFTRPEEIWEERKTEKSKGMTNLGRLDFQSGLSGQNLDAPYLVLYNSSAQDANAVAVRRKDLDLEFIAESVTYAFYTHSVTEAYYLAAVFNSAAPNERMKDFQARGLFGARHVHKKILDVYFPRFDKGDDRHARLARLGETAHAKAAEFLRANPPAAALTPARLGRLRAAVKGEVAAELGAINELVAEIIAWPPAGGGRIDGQT